MKLMRASFAVAFLFPAVTAAQQPGHREAVKVESSLPPSANPESDQFVRVSASIALGPMGYAQVPSGLTQVAGASASLATVNASYNFPSLYIYISASPLLLPQLSDAKKLDSIESVRDGDRDVNWMDASFNLDPVDENGNELSCDSSLSVIGLLPGATVTGNKNSTASDAANTANQLMTALVPFFPGVKAVGQASTSALQILFTDLFPPKTKSYQYAFLDGACSFGWFYKANPTATPPTSILGIQSGLVMLRTTTNVRHIAVTSRILSSWTKPPTASSKQFSYVTKTMPIDIPTVKSSIDYGALQDLSLFPALISAADAQKILHISKDADWQGLITAKPGGTPMLQTTPDGSYVMKASLQKYLQLSN